MKMNRPLKKITSALLLVALFASWSAVALAADNPDTAGQRILSWEVTGPLGGDVRSLVVDPQDPQRLYFGTIDGQIYATADGGTSWSRLEGFNRPGLLIDNIIIDPRDSKTIYAAANRYKEAAGFFKTTDGGTTWREAEPLRSEGMHSMT